MNANKNQSFFMDVKSKNPFWKCIFGLFVGLFLTTAFVYYNPKECPLHKTVTKCGLKDKVILRARSSERQIVKKNPTGVLGTYVSFWMFRSIGICAWLISIYSLFIATFLAWIKKISAFSLRNLLFFFLCVIFTCAFLTDIESIFLKSVNYCYFSAGLGGLTGKYFANPIVQDLLGNFGSLLLFGILSSAFLYISFLREISSKVILWPIRFLSGLMSKMSLLFRKFFAILRNATFFHHKTEKSDNKKISRAKQDESWNASANSDFEKDENSKQKLGEKLKNLFLRFRNWLKSRSERKHESKSDKKDEIISFSLFKKQNENPIKIPGIVTNFDEFEQTKTESGKNSGIFSSLNSSVKSTEIVKKRNTSDLFDSEAIKIIPPEIVEKTTESKKTEGEYIFPPVSLLESCPIEDMESSENHQKRAELLVAKLAEFGVDVKVQEIHSGPVITRYEITPSVGVRVEKIINLEKNIALGLRAISVRIVAPVPGKGCVGIELPNEHPLPVHLRDILESKAWVNAKVEIPIVLGKEVTGRPIVADLTRMPHLLIAGSTGSGKTVCINTIIASLLFHSSPKNLRFLMVDPKIVEMKIYNDLPHMLIPVVTDPKKVPAALKWLISEMERRYHLFAKVNARNITSYNEKLEKTDEQKIPYIVCIVDELADLMMVAPADIETCIARLAQLARAAGIHLIIATQRPSVNVITGVIKANLPSRIAFKVASKVDSRTILDYGGADNLIGRGDMLFIPPGSSVTIRAQGAFVSDDEINNIVNFIKENGPPVEYAQEILNHIDELDQSIPEVKKEDSDTWDDDLIPKALEIIRTNDRASISFIQRRLRIGYNRAARIIETLQERGLINSQDLDRS